MSRTGWIAWTIVTGLWLGVVIHLIGEAQEKLCAPAKNNVVVRLSQNKNAKEVGVVYLNYNEAQATRDGLDAWLRQYSQCP